MRVDPIPRCPSCGSRQVVPNGRDGSSRYAANVVYHAWRCICGKAFTVAEMAAATPDARLARATAGKK